MLLQDYLELLNALERETNSQKRRQAEEFYYKLRDEQPEIFVGFTVQLIQQNHPQASFATILFRRDCDKRGLSSALYQCPNVHEIVVSLLPFLLQQNHLLEIITQHLQLCLQKRVDFSEFLPFFQQLCVQNKQLAAQLSAEVLTLPMSLLSRIDIDFVQLSMAFLGEDDATAALAMKSLANYAFLHEGGLNDEQFYHILGRYQMMIQNDERTCDFKVLDAMNQQISRIIDLSKNVVHKYFVPFVEMVQTVFLKSQNKQLQLRMLKIGNKFISAIENAQEAFPTIKQYLQQCVIPSVGMYENYQLEEWIQLGNVEFQADDLIQNGEKMVETMSIKWACSVVNPVLRECFSRALTTGDFKYQIACLMSLNFAAEGFVDVIPIDSLEFYIGSTIQLINVHDQHPRVLFSAANVIGQLANDFEHQIAKYHKMLLPVLLRMSDHPVVHVRSHFIAAMLNVTITMSNGDLAEYAPALRQLVERHWADTDLYMRSNILSTLCTLVEISTEQDVSQLLCALLPQILDLFQQIMAPVSADQELTKTQLDLVQRVIEALGFAMSYFPHLFTDIAPRVIAAYQQVMMYAYSHRIVDLLGQAVRSLIKTQRLADYTPIIADQLALFYDAAALPFISFRNDVQGEGDMCVDTNATELQIAVFQLISDEAQRNPEYFVQQYAKIMSAIAGLNSPNQTVSVMQIQLSINMLQTAALIDADTYFRHLSGIIEQLREQVDDTALNGKHFEIETLQFVYQGLRDLFFTVHDNASKYGFLPLQSQEQVVALLYYQAEQTAVILDQELALVARVRADAGETQKLVKQLVMSYFCVYEHLANTVWPFIEASGAELAPQQTLAALHKMATELLQKTATSSQQRDSPILQLAISILGDLTRRGVPPDPAQREFICRKIIESDNPRLIHYCAYYMLFCPADKNAMQLHQRCVGLQQMLSQSSSAFASIARDYLALLAYANGQKTQDDVQRLFSIQYDPLAIELAVRELIRLPESQQVALGLRKMQQYANKIADAAIEEYCRRNGV